MAVVMTVAAGGGKLSISHHMNYVVLHTFNIWDFTEREKGFSFMKASEIHFLGEISVSQLPCT